MDRLIGFLVMVLILAAALPAIAAAAQTVIPALIVSTLILLALRLRP